jgi:hypothetical protein
MYFIKIDGNFVEFIFKAKKDAIVFIVDHLKRQNFEDAVTILKQAEKVNIDDTDIIRTDTTTFTIFKMYEYSKCSLCDDSMKSKHTLQCSHNVCLECLPKLRKNECPICRKELSGEAMTDEILCNILQRTEIDEHEERQNDELMALAAEFGYNPNDLY